MRALTPMVMVSLCAILGSTADNALAAVDGNTADCAGQPVAFPGAEGAGRCAVGGRDGDTRVVTNLGATGAGSLYEALTDNVPVKGRIIVFAVSGAIDLTVKNANGVKEGGTLTIDHSNITIEGQSAPGDGIVITGGTLRVKASNVILRHLRARRGVINANNDAGDAVWVEGDTPNAELILDHVSASWATDENLSIRNVRNSTLQWGLVAEGLNYTNAAANPTNHGYGSIWSANGDVAGVVATLHHTLYAHNSRRSPHVGLYEGSNAPTMDFRNNVVYDWWDYSSHTNGSVSHNMNWVNNYYRRGPSTLTPAGADARFFTFDPSSTGSKMYAAGNLIDDVAASPSNMAYAFTALTPSSSFLRPSPFSAPAVTTQSAADALTSVLDAAGATLPSRDEVDLRIVGTVHDSNGQVINKESIVAPPDWKTSYYQDITQELDDDHDGMPNYWESQFTSSGNTTGLNANADPDGDKYVNIEEYLNNTIPNTSAERPMVYVGAADSRALFSDASNQGKWRVYRTGSTASALSVRFTLDGTASAGSQYGLASVTMPSGVVEGTATIPSGQSSVDIVLTGVAQSPAIPAGKAIFKVAANSAYYIGCPSRSLIVINP